jgi:hypothetical protein
MSILPKTAFGSLVGGVFSYWALTVANDVFNVSNTSLLIICVVASLGSFIGVIVTDMILKSKRGGAGD